MSEYWEKRYGSGGKVWGSTPSGTAIQASEVFRNNNVKEVLVIGSGYGRNANYFYEEGFTVEGIEYTNEGIDIARTDNPNINYYHDSAFNMPLREAKYDAVYCYNVLHLFVESERNKLIELCREVVKPNGLLYFTSFSENEASYGNGEEIEWHTFETKKGKPIHFYDEKDIISAFQSYELIETDLYTEHENHGDEGEHEHILRYIIVKNT